MRTHIHDQIYIPAYTHKERVRERERHMTRVTQINTHKYAHIKNMQTFSDAIEEMNVDIHKGKYIRTQKRMFLYRHLHQHVHLKNTIDA